MVNYIDDFLICARDEETCQLNRSTFLQELSWFGFACNKGKIMNPNTKVKYLGMIIDSTDMTLSLPTEKRI